MMCGVRDFLDCVRSRRNRIRIRDLAETCSGTTPSRGTQECFAILPNQDFVPEFMQLWFRANYQRLRLQTEGRGGNQPNLNGGLLNQELVPLPVQRALAARLRSEITAATELRTTLEAKLATLDRLPAALLRQVFGEPEGEC